MSISVVGIVIYVVRSTVGCWGATVDDDLLRNVENEWAVMQF